MKFTILVQPYMRREDEEVGLAGTDSNRFSDLLERLIEQMKFADKNGYHGFCMTEQHLQVEGIEVTTNPLLYGLYVAQHTENLHVGQLGIPITAHNPIMVAENLALADHFTKGRFFCGFARGNTSRWADTFSQHLNLGAATSDKSEKDEMNRQAFQESVQIIKKLWTEDTIQFKGRYWNIPHNVSNWQWGPTDAWGSHAVDQNGQLKEIGIVPHPYQKPHPPIYAPFAFSMESARFWAREGGKLVSFVSNDEFVQVTIDEYMKEARKTGRNVTHADALALGGHLIMGRTEQETESIYQGFEKLYNFAYNCPPYNVPMGRLFKGSQDQVAEQIGKLEERFGIDEIILWHHVGYFPQEVELRMLELFADGVIKKFAVARK